MIFWLRRISLEFGPAHKQWSIWSVTQLMCTDSLRWTRFFLSDKVSVWRVVFSSFVYIHRLWHCRHSSPILDSAERDAFVQRLESDANRTGHSSSGSRQQIAQCWCRRRISHIPFSLSVRTSVVLVTLSCGLVPHDIKTWLYWACCEFLVHLTKYHYVIRPVVTVSPWPASAHQFVGGIQPDNVTVKLFIATFLGVKQN